MPRELAASPRSRRTSARKRTTSASASAVGAGPSDSTRLDTASAAGSRTQEQAPPAFVQEEALSEIRHELGNFFHKLYYWLDALAERRPDGSEQAAAPMLEQLVRNLEDFLGSVLEYFRPVTLARVPMTAADVVAGVRARVEGRLAAGALSLEPSGGLEGHTLLVDPARLPEVLDTALRRLVAQAPSGTPVRLAAGHAQREGTAGLHVELALGDQAADLPAFHTAADGLAWALAQRVAVLHGGALAEQVASDARRTIVLFLPYHA